MAELPADARELINLSTDAERCASAFMAYLRAKEAAERSGVIRPSDSEEPVAIDFLDDFRHGPNKDRRLTLRQKIFIAEFLVDMNAARACRAAGYSGDTRRATYELFSCAHIREAVRLAMRHRMERLRINQDRVIRELANIAFFDPQEVLQGEGDNIGLKNINEISKDARKAIKRIIVTPGAHGRSISVEFQDKVQALNLLGKHQGMWQERLVIKDESEQVKALEAARRRVIEATKVETTYTDVRESPEQD